MPHLGERTGCPGNFRSTFKKCLKHLTFLQALQSVCTAAEAQSPITTHGLLQALIWNHRRSSCEIALPNIPLQNFPWYSLLFAVAMIPSLDSPSQASKQLYLIKLGHNLPQEGMQHRELFAQVDVAVVSRHVWDGIWVRELPQKTLHSSPLVFQKFIHEGHVLFLNTKPAGKGGGGKPS